MKIRFYTILLLCILIFAGCGKQGDNNSGAVEKSEDTVIAPQEPKDNTQVIESQSDESTEGNNYSRYNGVWTTDGISKEELLETGGTELTLNITNGNQVSGSLFSQQEITDRIANIDFSGEIHDNQLVYTFNDDGWDGKGT